ncbi:MAG: hypothetical protein SGCHY_002230 [Lobulomycetales sp.]
MPAKFIRVKRFKQTFFVESDAQDTVLGLKQRLEPLTGKQAGDVRLLLSPSTPALDDHAVLDQVGVQDDTVVYMVYWIPGEQVFETVNVPSFETSKEQQELEQLESSKGKAQEAAH